VDLLLAAGADVSDLRAQSHCIAGALRSGDERILQRLLDAGASSDSLALTGFPTLAHFMHPPGDDDVALNIPPSQHDVAPVRAPLHAAVTRTFDAATAEPHSTAQLGTGDAETFDLCSRRSARTLICRQEMGARCSWTPLAAAL
jgi:hypothetical protein